MPSGRDWQIPVGDRDHDDTRGERAPKQYVWPETAPNVPPRKPGEGLGSYLARMEAEGGLVPQAVPVYECPSCDQEFSHEPVVSEDEHVEEAKRRGRTWCSKACLEKYAELCTLDRYADAVER